MATVVPTNHQIMATMNTETASFLGAWTSPNDNPQLEGNSSVNMCEPSFRNQLSSISLLPLLAFTRIDSNEPLSPLLTSDNHIFSITYKCNHDSSPLTTIQLYLTIK